MPPKKKIKKNNEKILVSEFFKNNNDVTSNSSHLLINNKCNSGHNIYLDFPMLANKITNFNQLDLNKIEYYYEEKFDGERIILVKNYDSIHCYSRTLKLKQNLNFIFHLDFNKNIDKCILDGELIFFNKKLNKIVPHYSTGTRSELTQIYKVFDIIQLDDNLLKNETLQYRKKILDNILKENKYISKVKYFKIENLKHLENKFNNIINTEHGEGLIIKPINSLYIPNNRSHWVKIKKLHLIDKREEFDLFVHRIESDKTNINSILHCGYYDKNNNFVFVCKVSSGITSDVIQFFNTLLLNENCKVLKKKVIVTVTGDSITNKKSIRFPKFLKIRLDLNDIDINKFI